MTPFDFRPRTRVLFGSASSPAWEKWRESWRHALPGGGRSGHAQTGHVKEAIRTLKGGAWRYSRFTISP